MFLTGFLKIANEKMVDAIKKMSIAKGYEPGSYALVAFGGAGGQHMCSIAESLGIETIIAPFYGSLLSAYGIGNAVTERFYTCQVLKDIDIALTELQSIIKDLTKRGFEELGQEGIASSEIKVREVLIYLRFNGQDSVLEVSYKDGIDIKSVFKKTYTDLFGHWIENKNIEVESIKVVVSSKEK